MQLLTAGNAELLEAQGFGIAELAGFEHHAMPLYAHRPISDKKPGDVVLRARVGNPDSLDDGEAAYLARKAFHGMFPWLPGADCIRRTFVDLTFRDGGLSDDRSVERSARAKGCRWCRKGKRRGQKARRQAL